MSRNGVIGRGNQLPWHLPADLKHFKQLTIGHTIIMGRKTWQSIGRPLPERRSIVISRDPRFDAPGATVVTNLDEALAAAGDEAEVFVIGGAQVYRLALPRADRLYVTHIEADVPGDAFFPAIDPSQWTAVSREEHPVDERHAYPFHFVTYERSR